MLKLNRLVITTAAVAIWLAGPAFADQPIFQAPSATAPTSTLPYCTGAGGGASPVVNGVQTASQACQPVPTAVTSTAGLPQPSNGTPYASTTQMMGGVSWGESIAAQGSANPLLSNGGTSTSFSATPLGGSPADGAGTSPVGYQATANYSLRLACNRNPAVPNQQVYSAGGISLAVGACTVTGTGSSAQVASMNLAACSNTVNGGTCTQVDYNYSTFYLGQMQDLNGAQAAALIVSCPADGSLTCLVNVQSISSLQVSGNNLKAAGTTASATNPEVQLLSGTLTGTAPNSGLYQGTIQTWAQSNSAYYAKTEQQLNSPTAAGNISVTTWDGKQTATLNANNCPPPTQQCVQYATTTNNWAQSCTSDVPSTVQTCTTTTPTVTCQVSDQQATYSCNDTLTAAVSETPATCNFGSTVYGGFNNGDVTNWFTVSCSGGAIQVIAGAWQVWTYASGASYVGWVDFAEYTGGNSNYVTGSTVNSPGTIQLTAGQAASGSGSGYYSFGPQTLPYSYTFDGTTLTLAGSGPDLSYTIRGSPYKTCSTASCPAYYPQQPADTLVSAKCVFVSKNKPYNTVCRYLNIVSTTATLPITPVSITTSTSWNDSCAPYEAAQ